jgi:tetratricopeptide (TPR) repeat protein
MESPPDHTPAASVESRVARIRGHLERGQYAEAMGRAEALLKLVPENRDVHYMLAVSYRCLDRIADALAELERLQQLDPKFSRLYQERGHCFVALRDSSRAIEAYLHGVAINPALPASWTNLEALYRMSGDADNAGKAAAHVATLKRLPPEVVTATALFSDGELTAAESIVRSFLLRHGDHVEAMRLLARIGMARQVFDDAETLLGAVLAIVPAYDAARFDYARTLLERHKHAQAIEQLEQLLQRDPGNRQYKTLYATACTGIGNHEKALALYRALLDGAPHAADIHLSIGHTQKTLGNYDESVCAYRAAAATRPAFGDAYWSLANLKTYEFTDSEIESMRAQESAPANPLVDRYHLCFALGMAFEKRGQYEDSFRYYEKGNALKHSEIRYQPELVELNTRLQKEVCTRQFFAARSQAGVVDSGAIFIVGLPRSGSTLLEQILASHSAVEGTHELANIPRIVGELMGRDEVGSMEPRYPRVLAEMQPEEFRRVGERYLQDTRAYRTGKPHFIDKMPNNFRHLGLIHLMLPGARIIDARREPMACCFSNLKQLFAAGQEFTYGVDDIARYYRTYLELMRHWDEALPGSILRVIYEDVVDDLEASVRRLLDFCGLPFEAQCLDFHNTQRSVRTASSEQVRQPLYREGLEQWKNYEPWLGPLKIALGDALMTWRR